MDSLDARSPQCHKSSHGLCPQSQSEAQWGAPVRLCIAGVYLNAGVALHCDGIARSNERKTGVAVSGDLPGYAVPLHYGRRNTRVQTWQSLETAENDSRPLDGTKNEPIR